VRYSPHRDHDLNRVHAGQVVFHALACSSKMDLHWTRWLPGSNNKLSLLACVSVHPTGLLPQTTPTSAPPQPCYALHVLRDCSSLLHGLRQLGASTVKQACLCRAMVLGTAVGWPRRRGYPFLTGVAYSVAWGDLEPSDNNFDFTGMDASLNQTVGYGWCWYLIVSVRPKCSGLAIRQQRAEGRPHGQLQHAKSHTTSTPLTKCISST
jgi:hypothetical protein